MTNKKHNYDWDAMRFNPGEDVYEAFPWHRTPQGYDWWFVNRDTPEGQSEFARMKRLYAEDMSAKKSPVRTVTKKEIVPGVYGTVVVEGEFVRMEDTILGRANLGVLNDAIETLTQIRDALEEKE